MAEAVPLARSPICPAPPETVVAGWVVSARRSSADLTLTDCTPLAKVLTVELPRAAFGTALRQAWDGRKVLFVGRRPDEQLVLGPAGAEAALVAWLERTALAVDLTHALALVRITGARAADVLAKECGIDLSTRAFADGSACGTAVAALACDVIRDDRAGTPSYLISCDRSAGQYLFDALIDAGGEFGIDVAGFGEEV